MCQLTHLLITTLDMLILTLIINYTIVLNNMIPASRVRRTYGRTMWRRTRVTQRTRVVPREMYTWGNEKSLSIWSINSTKIVNDWNTNNVTWVILWYSVITFFKIFYWQEHASLSEWPSQATSVQMRPKFFVVVFQAVWM